MKRVVCTLSLLLLAMVPFFARSADTAPDVLVKNTVNEVMSVLKQAKDKRALIDLAEQKVLPHFDFTEMTRLAVGRAWRDANDAQKKALENGFRTLLVNTYTAALSQAAKTDYSVEIKPTRVQPDQKDVVVRTVVKNPGGNPISVDYSMHRTAAGWKVYDVMVENLSLVTNYRSSFSAEVARGGIDGLIRSLEEKNRKLATG